MDIASVSAPLGQYFTDLLQARREDSLPADATALSAAGAVKILELKSAHRQLCESTDALRVAASEAKSQLDSSSLQLQNLLYERQHYEKEIASCLGWQSAYTDEQIALVSPEEFAALQPAAEGDVDAPHPLMLRRLAHEAAYRQEFVKGLDAVRARRDALAADVAQKRGAVAGLEAEVSKLLASARAVQQLYAPAAAAAAGGDAEEEDAAAAAAVQQPAALDEQLQQQQLELLQQQQGDAAMTDAPLEPRTL